MGYTGIYIDRKGKYCIICGIPQYIRIGKIKKITGFEHKTSCILHRCSYHCTTSVDISKIDANLGMHITCRLVPDARRRASSAPRAGHDVASMGLPGHLDSLGLDSEVLARVLASTSRQF